MPALESSGQFCSPIVGNILQAMYRQEVKHEYLVDGHPKGTSHHQPPGIQLQSDGNPVDKSRLCSDDGDHHPSLLLASATLAWQLVSRTHLVPWHSRPYVSEGQLCPSL